MKLSIKSTRPLIWMGVALSITSCNSDSASTTGGSSSSSSTSTASTTSISAAVVKAAVSGKVSTVAGASGLFQIRAKALGHSFAQTNNCSSGTFTSAFVGGGAPDSPNGSFSSGSFTIPAIPSGKELVITFTCSNSTTQRCLAKAGDAGIGCDPLSDAVLGAFESALGKSITDSAFQGKSIAKIASSIQQQAAANSSNTAISSFISQVQACSSNASPAACKLAAITASPFNGAFQLMKTMVNGWDIGSMIALMTDVLGFQITVDSFTFSNFGTRLDTWLSTDFVARATAYISTLVANQAAGTNTSPVQILCKMSYSKSNSWGTIKYFPVMATNSSSISAPTCNNSAALIANGLTSGQASTVGTAYDSNNNHNQIQLGTASCSGGGWGQTGYFCVDVPQLVLVAKNAEANRNNPTGATNLPGYQDLYTNEITISLINVFTPVMTQLQSPSIADPASCMSGGTNGPPTVVNSTVCNTWFASVLAPVKTYFSGVMGLYMALASNSLGTRTNLSLKDIYKLATQAKFLDGKWIASSPYLMGRNSTAGNSYSPPILNETGTNACTIANDFYNSGGGGGMGAALDPNTLAADFQNSAVSYENSFKMFETIPTATAIRDFIYKTAYHVDFNRTGAKTFSAAGGKNAGGTGLPVDPIFCKMTDASGNLVELDMLSNPTVLVSCQDAQALSVTVDSSGNVTVPTNFSYNYTLNQWGYQGDSKGSLYQLVNWRNGQPITPAGQNQFVYQMHSGNSICTGSDGNTGKVVTATMSMSNGSNSFTQNLSAFCMDMAAFTSSSNFGFYWGGNLAITQTDPSGNANSWSVMAVGGLNASSGDFSTNPVCAFASSSAFTTDATTGYTKTGTVTVNTGTGAVSGLGANLLIDYCSATHANTTLYGLVAMGNTSWGTSRSSIYAELIPVKYTAASGSTPGGISSTGVAALAYRTWQNGDTDPSSQLVKIDAATLSAAFNTQLSGSSDQYRVAPISAPTQTVNISLVNQLWESKFDPFCDSSGGGVCHCLDGTTGAAKAGGCTLEDTPTDPTISSAPYWPGQSNISTYTTFFSTYGNKSGSQLVYTSSGTSHGLGWDYLNQNQIFLDTSQVVQCLYTASGETSPRHPQGLGPDWSQDQQGCPASAGGSVSNSTQGPVRIINPIAMNNAYIMEHPQTAIKMVNYATKDTGQGIALDPNAKVFTFDTALALLAFRMQAPISGISVTTDSGISVPNVMGVFQLVRDPAADANSNTMSPSDAVLCYLASSGAGCQ